MAADYAVAAHEPPLDGEEVHRAPLALYHPGPLAVELGHNLIRVGTQEQGVRVVAVGSDDLVALLVGLQKAGGDGFLTDVDVEIASDLALPETPLARFFEGPYDNHLFVQVHETLRAGRYRPALASLYAPVLRVLVICRH